MYIDSRVTIVLAFLHHRLAVLPWPPPWTCSISR
jgi:hypothetical protein